MNSKIKKFIIVFISLGVLLLTSGELCYAIGEFGIGVNLGMTYDPNYLEDEITYYNMKVEDYKQQTSGASAETMTVSYAPVVGFNMRYLFNHIIFRIGCQYTKPIRQMEGSVTNAAGEKNKIKMKTFQFSLPLTVGLVLPLKDRTYFFVGGGPSFIYSYIKTMRTGSTVFTAAAIDMDNDGSADTNETDKYAVGYAGFHFIFGAEVQILDNFSLSTEWIHQEGKSSTIGNDGLDSSGAETKGPRRVIYADGDFFLFGVSYYIKM